MTKNVENLENEEKFWSSDSARIYILLTSLLTRLLIIIKTFGVYWKYVAPGRDERQNLHATFSIHEMLKGKSLK